MRLNNYLNKHGVLVHTPLAVPREYMDSVINNGSLGFSLHEAFIEEIEQALNYNETEDMNELNSGERLAEVCDLALREHLEKRKEEERRIFRGQNTALSRGSRRLLCINKPSAPSR